MIEIAIQKAFPNKKDGFSIAINFEVNEGDFVGIYGPSGAGKTTLLRLITGLSTPDKGYLKVGGKEWFNSNLKIDLPPQKREVGMVFQDFALFPNMTVHENLKYALKKGTDKAIINQLIEIMELSDLIDQYPSTLSGGQKQRVGMARAMVQSPKVLLLDEPLSALDPKMRQKLQLYLIELHKQLKPTIFMISHDIGELYKLTHQVIGINDGKVAKIASPQEFFSSADLSGKFKFTAEILAIEKHDILHVATLFIGNHLVKVILDKDEVDSFSIGDKVTVAAKAFNPSIYK
ncbi:ATP-binding cassette domain-containing protein [Flammeovirga pectinis]|uniref:ATP-binding cassette domain-containing protein n=1 Tax=Flammeovirga pectinis TaxID=2494373 RepID=A0A3Q9FPE3_9BACT|nr:ATP-binding cassette domain-containing protein [Flammeovirga pectinis]AZQ61751.1 ATP-binding cassette domain-containing protein [Flammeovirga pectinis]